MVNLYLGGIIATASIVLLGIIIALPPLLQPIPATNVILSFSVVSDINMPDWCLEVSELLKEKNIDASFFISGKLAEEYRDCVRSFDPVSVDIGSSTYNYTDLTSQVDYSQLLGEVKKGKQALDDVGNIDSRSFRAPYGRTDDNIYSLLSRSGIFADFSYADRYHKYDQTQFIRFDADVYDATTRSGFKTFLADRAESNKPILVYFDNTVPLSEVKDIVQELKVKKVTFVNASTLTTLDLTVTGGA
jgi:peptidoglycan/xylan/chitin deacetylase (PgdA/CDA1 family)